MAKIFNEEIIDYLRKNSKQCRFNPNLYEPGDTFIVKEPRAKRREKVFVANTEEDSGAPAAEAETEEDAPVMVEPAIDPHPECKIIEEEDAKECFPSEHESQSGSESEENTTQLCEDDLKGGGDARRQRNDLFTDLTPSQIASFCSRCCHGSATSPIRCILGPFPDEPIISAVDRFLTILGLTLGAKSDELGDFDESCIEYETEDESCEEEEEDEDCEY